jgi:hypothetical protein
MALTKAHNRMISGAPINIRDYGATGDGVTDDSTAFINALADGYNLYIPAGIYVMKTMDINIGINGSANKRTIRGEGMNSTKLYWDDYTDDGTAGIKCSFNFAGLEVSDLTIKGKGKAENASSGVVTGLYDTGNDSSYNIEFNRVEFSDWSGNGLECTKWFDTVFNACSARYIGQNGYVIDGGQSVFWNGAGNRWFYDIGYNSGAKDGYALWVKQGYTEVTGFNSSAVHNGIKLGVDTNNRVTAQIRGLNLEWIRGGGTGVYVAAFSSLVECLGATQYGPDGADFTGTETALYGIYFEQLYKKNVITDWSSVWYSSSGTLGTDYPVHIASNYSSASILELSVSPTNQVPMGGGDVDFINGSLTNVVFKDWSNPLLEKDYYSYQEANSGQNTNNEIYANDLIANLEDIDGKGLAAIVTVVITSTGTADAFCVYTLYNNSTDSARTVEHIAGNSTINGSRPYIVYDNGFQWRMDSSLTSYIGRVSVQLITDSSAYK